jgi:hypothetical protein
MTDTNQLLNDATKQIQLMKKQNAELSYRLEKMRNFMRDDEWGAFIRAYPQAKDWFK